MSDETCTLRFLWKRDNGKKTSPSCCFAAVSPRSLSPEEKLKGAQVRQRYERLLAEMADVSASSEALTTMLTTFRKVTASYWPGLFHCYDVPDLPRTNNGLEHYFGSARYSER